MLKHVMPGLASLEHAVFIDGISRDRLADIPKLRDPILFKAENMHDSGTTVVGVLSHSREDGHLSPSSRARCTSSTLLGFLIAFDCIASFRDAASA